MNETEEMCVSIDTKNNQNICKHSPFRPWPMTSAQQAWHTFMHPYSLHSNNQKLYMQLCAYAL
jgi:hypothetical protein